MYSIYKFCSIKNSRNITFFYSSESNLTCFESLYYVIPPSQIIMSFSPFRLYNDSGVFHSPKQSTMALWPLDYADNCCFICFPNLIDYCKGKRGDGRDLCLQCKAWTWRSLLAISRQFPVYKPLGHSIATCTVSVQGVSYFYLTKLSFLFPASPTLVQCHISPMNSQIFLKLKKKRWDNTCPHILLT